jgi:hypothetical protein
MTVEEAIERLLEGRPWLYCPHCEDGTVRIEGGKGTDQCPSCDGFCSILDPDYAEACRLTGKEVPTERTGIHGYRIPISKIIECNSMADMSAIDAMGFKVIVE